MKHIPIGTVVVVAAPGSRGDDGPPREIPALVTRQWEDGSLELYACHFEGVPIMMRSVPLSSVHLPGMTEPIERPRSFAIDAH